MLIRCTKRKESYIIALPTCPVLYRERRRWRLVTPHCRMYSTSRIMDLTPYTEMRRSREGSMCMRVGCCVPQLQKRADTTLVRFKIIKGRSGRPFCCAVLFLRFFILLTWRICDTMRYVPQYMVANEHALSLRYENNDTTRYSKQRILYFCFS